MAKGSSKVENRDSALHAKVLVVATSGVEGQDQEGARNCHPVMSLLVMAI